MMRKLDLDFNVRHQRVAWPGWALLLAGLALWGEMSFSYVRLHQEMSDMEKELIKYGIAGKTQQHKGVATYTPEELVQAQETIARIAIPWGALFRAVESVKIQRVALLALEPDPKTGTLLLRGEAGDLPDVLTYISRLSQTKPLDEVYLLHHEIGQGGNAQRPVVFTISAHWETRS